VSAAVAGASRTGSAHLAAQLSAPARRLLRSGVAGAALMVVATVVALVWANSPWADSYDALWHTELALRLGDAEIAMDLQHWVNDGLMVFFFFLIGMEVRRELSMGELVQRSRLTVPTLAAVAGLVLPALLYLAINAGGDGAVGWGIPMATDTAFVLGALALFGRHTPIQLRVFLLSLSVVDDIGALSAIAVFYSDEIDLVALGIAGLCVFLFIGLSRMQVWRGPAYFAVGTVMWVAMYESGVHATIGGVVLGLLVSAYPPRRAEVERAGSLARAFRQSPEPSLAREAKLSVERAISPNERIGAVLVPWSSYVVVPIFALANAGVRIDGALLERAVTSPVTIGVFVGLAVGKLLGVGLAAWLGVRLRLGALPPGVTLGNAWSGAALCGLGFTVSLFVTDLAFDDEALREEATVGILAAAVVSAALGALFFRLLSGEGSTVERPTRLDPAVDPEVDHVRGPDDAPLTLVEYGDMECPFCGRATGVVSELRARFGDDLRYVFRHLPLVEVHPHAQLAAEAVEAAGAQGKFWEMHDKLFAHQDLLEAPDLLDHASALGLDLERFARELGDGTYGQHVRDDVAGAEASGVEGTPTFFVNGVRHQGRAGTDELAAALLASDPRGTPQEQSASPAPTPRQRPPAPLSPPARLPGVEGAVALEDLVETEDPSGASPRLDDRQLAVLRRAGRRRTTTPGEVLVRGGASEWDFVVVLEGIVAVVEDPDPGVGGRPRVVMVVGPGRFLGGLNMLAGQRAVRSVVAAAPGVVVTLTVQRLREVMTADRELADLIMRSFLLRRAMLIGKAAGLRVIGERSWPASEALQAVLTERGIAHQWLDPAENESARAMLAEIEALDDHRPVVVAPDGRVLVNPTPEDLVRAAGAPG
jgi:Na+/H+ antiporter NhaA